MVQPIILHAQHAINCANIIEQAARAQKYFKHKQLLLVPYRCQEVNHNNRLITGTFVNPMWKVFERNLLCGGGHFTHSYVKTPSFSIEITPHEFKDYHIFGQSYIYANKVRACPATLLPNSILLFPVHKDIAQPLINNKLM